MPSVAVVASAALALLALAAMPARSAAATTGAGAATAAGAKPWFCHELDCPEYEVVENLTSIGVELRRYAPSTWVETIVENATSVAPVPAAAPAMTNGGRPAASVASDADANAGTGYERAVAVGFYKLFRYISGENLTGEKIAMTAPVRVTVTPGVGPTCGDTFKIAFFLSPSLSAGGKVPPPPSDATVKIVQTPEAAYYVNGFGGWATGATYVDRARSVAAALEGAGRAVDDGYFITAGYDSPFRLRNRHNEVWLPAMEVEADKAAVMAKAVAAKAPAAAKKPSATLKLPKI